MITTTLLALLSQAAPAADATVVTAPVSAATVHPDRARVTRRTGTLEDDGAYRFEGLTGRLDPDSVRARVPGGVVLSVDVRARVLTTPPGERMAAFDAEQRELDARRADLADEWEVLTALSNGLARFGTPPTSDRATVGDPEAWRAGADFLTEQTARDAERRRGLEARGAELDRLQQDLNRRRGEWSAPTTPTYEALVEVDVPDGGGVIELEYLVPNAGWEPRYELRAASDARSVAVSYRAQVWQKSGEDWDGVRLALSTAAPRRGAAAPTLETRWAHTLEPGVYARAEEQFDREAGRLADSAAGYDYRKAPAAEKEPVPYAVVRDAGLSLFYELPATDTVRSGAPPASVLIGALQLGIEPEYHCVPALDTTVWLRGRATNDSALTFLPGEASVFFGADHLGRARLDTVRPGQDFVMHLGADHALEVTRRMIGEGTEGAGFFGSKDTWHRTWSVRVENHGAAIAEPDGAAVVYVREALPRATDDRLDVRLEKSNQPTAQGERWQTDREDHGFETWVLRAPRGGQAELRYELRIRHPEDAELRFR